MCGIAGIVGDIDKDALAKMSSALVHRGPDAEGQYIDLATGVQLAHRRLIILDKEGGKQPMQTSDGNIVVTFNGEIYNHHELRLHLASRGHKFQSNHSDTEVLIHGYREWGPELCLKLNGMFAFAIWDKPNNQLFLARDRMGEKPLFWSMNQNTFGFASELPAILAHPRWTNAAFDSTSIAKFFAYSFFPGDKTPYKGIQQLQPGSYLQYNIKDQIVTQQRYWQFRINETISTKIRSSENSLIDECRHLLDIAVQRRLESDVPLGVFLSGGLDSSAILAFAAKKLPLEQLKAFTIGFAEKSFDELPFAQAMAHHVGCKHFTQTCDFAIANTKLSPLLRQIPEPICDGSILPTYLLCEFTRKHVTVALSGDGGDELFAGYDTFGALETAKKMNRFLPRGLHPAIRFLANRLPISSANMSLDFKVRRGIRALGQPPSCWNPMWLGACTHAEIQELCGRDYAADELYSEAIAEWEACDSASPIDKTLEFYTKFYLPNNILVKTDRASMQVSLEVRAPFLDNDLVDFAAKLPTNMKFRDGETKYILKKALTNVVPNQLVTRKKKGFGIPLYAWLKNVDLSPPQGNLGLRQDVLRKWAEEHRSGKRDFRHAILASISIRESLNSNAR